MALHPRGLGTSHNLKTKKKTTKRKRKNISGGSNISKPKMMKKTTRGKR